MVKCKFCGKDLEFVYIYDVWVAVELFTHKKHNCMYKDSSVKVDPQKTLDFFTF